MTPSLWHGCFISFARTAIRYVESSGVISAFCGRYHVAVLLKGVARFAPYLCLIFSFDSGWPPAFCECKVKCFFLICQIYFRFVCEIYYIYLIL